MLHVGFLDEQKIIQGLLGCTVLVEFTLVGLRCHFVQSLFLKDQHGI